MRKIRLPLPIMMDGETIQDREARFLEYSWKLVQLNSYPFFLAALPGAVLWYFVLYRNHIHFGPDILETVNAAIIPSLGVLYGLISTILLGMVIQKYFDIREAIDCGEFHAFMKRRRQRISPIFHGVMTIPALGMLFCLAGLPYAHWYTGVGFFGGGTYLFSLYYWVMREVDDPFRGIWYIRSVPSEWLQVDLHKYRERMSKQNRDVWVVFLEEKEGDETTPQRVAAE